MKGREVLHPEFAQDETLCSDDGFRRRCVHHCQLLDLDNPRSECSKYEKVSKAVQHTTFRLGTCAVCVKVKKIQIVFDPGYSLTSMHRGIQGAIRRR